MEKEDFIDMLYRSDPNEIRNYIESNGKRKLVCPIVYVDEIEPEKMSTKLSDYIDAKDVDTEK